MRVPRAAPHLELAYYGALAIPSPSACRPSGASTICRRTTARSTSSSARGEPYSDPNAITVRQFLPQLQFAGMALLSGGTRSSRSSGIATRRVSRCAVLQLELRRLRPAVMPSPPRAGGSRCSVAARRGAAALHGLLALLRRLGMASCSCPTSHVAPRSIAEPPSSWAAVLALQFVHHAFSVVPTVLFLCILVGSGRAHRAEGRARASRRSPSFPRHRHAVFAWFRPQNPPACRSSTGAERRALILPRVVVRQHLDALARERSRRAGLVASLARFRRLERTERAYLLCAAAAAFCLVALPIVIPGWQFFNVRFAPFFVAFTLPLLPLERLRRPALEGAVCALSAACFVASAFAFHRSLARRAPTTWPGSPCRSSAGRGSASRWCSTPSAACRAMLTNAPVPFLGPAAAARCSLRDRAGRHDPETIRGHVRDSSGSRSDVATGRRAYLSLRRRDLPIGEEVSRLESAPAGPPLETVAIHAQAYDDVLLFGATDADVTASFGLRPPFVGRPSR